MLKRAQVLRVASLPIDMVRAAMQKATTLRARREFARIGSPTLVYGEIVALILPSNEGLHREDFSLALHLTK